MFKDFDVTKRPDGQVDVWREEPAGPQWRQSFRMADFWLQYNRPKREWQVLFLYRRKRYQLFAGFGLAGFRSKGSGRAGARKALEGRRREMGAKLRQRFSQDVQAIRTWRREARAAARAAVAGDSFGELVPPEVPEALVVTHGSKEEAFEALAGPVLERRGLRMAWRDWLVRRDVCDSELSRLEGAGSTCVW